MKTLGVFESLGLDSEEEATYLRVLRLDGSTLSAISRAMGMSANRLRRIVASLEDKGLITRTADRVPHFYPTPPETAVEVLILHRREEMERARLAANELGKEMRSRSHALDPLQLAEVLTGREAIDQRFQQIQRGAQREVLAFSKPPYVSSLENETEFDLLRLGVRYRILYDQAAFDVPGALESIERSVAAGEEARVFPSLPMKMILIDGDIAFMPLSVEQPYESAVLVVHGSAIVAALSMLFEALWSQAVPFGKSGGTQRKPQQGEVLGERDRRLIDLLAAGMKDVAIARHMGHDPRTVRRYVSQLLNQLGATTRFQAGLQVAKRGWV